jgi:apolipoprotein D and lipocalin family protein
MNSREPVSMATRLGPAGALLMLVGLLLAGCAADNPPQRLAPQVDRAAYAGRWYIIGEIPYFAERGEVGSYFEVSFDDTKVTDRYVGRAGSFDAKPDSLTMKGYVVPDTGNARWRESPFWPLYFSYLILYVDPDYRTALVGYPGHGYGWVLSRTPSMADDTYRALLQRFAAEGYDISQFRRVPQTPEEIGKPGFE